MLIRFTRTLVFPAIIECKISIAISILLLIATTIGSALIIEIARSVLELIKSQSGFENLTGFAGLVGGNTVSIRLFRLSLIGTSIPILLWVGMYYRDIYFERIAVGITTSIRKDIFARILKLRYYELTKIEPGAALRRVIDDTEQVRALIIDAGLRRVADIFMILFIIGYMASLNIVLAATSAISIAVFFVIAYWSAGLAKGKLRNRDITRDLLYAKTSEALSRVIDIRSSSKENFEIDKFSKVAGNHASASIECVRWLLLDRSITGYLRNFGPVAILLIGAWASIGEYISLANLVVIIAATSLLYNPVDSLSAVPITLRHAEVAAQNLYKLFEFPVEEDQSEAQFYVAAKPQDASTAQSLINCDNVSYRYPDHKQNLEIQKLKVGYGDRVVLSGPSGAGKSTILRILFGLLSPYEGKIYLFGRDLKTIPLRNLRSSIGYMTQESSIFSGTIRENIAYGADDPDNVADSDIISALDLAGLSNDIEIMGNGLNTHLESTGNNISTGQRRRIALARALLKKPLLLLLDEPFSNVSPDERLAISAAISTVSKQVSLFIVSHDDEMPHGYKRILLKATGTNAFCLQSIHRR